MRDLNTNESNRLQYIDLYLDKVGYGRYQILTLACLFLEDIADGAELTLQALILPCLAKEWDITNFQKCVLGAIIFFGMIFGALSSSKLCDQFGRKIILVIGSCLVGFFGVIASFADSYNCFLLYRFFVGVGIGLVFPASTTLASEITPVYGRSYYLNSIFISFPIGEIIVCISCYFFLNDCLSWRYVVLIASIPGIIALILTYFIDESPRFLLHKGRYVDAFQILEKYGEAKGLNIDEIHKPEMIKEVNNSFQKSVKIEFSTLLNQKYKKLTIKIWTSWILISFMFYGYIFIYPQILEEMSNKDSPSCSDHDIYINLTISSLINLPSTPIAGFLSENPKLGRRYSLVLATGIAGILCFLCFIFNGFIFIFGICIKFCLYIGFAILTIYTSELYPTKIRNMGNAIANSITRLGGIISPFLLEYLLQLTGVKGPYFLIMIMNLYMTFVAKSFNKETYKAGVDSDFFLG